MRGQRLREARRAATRTTDVVPIAATPVVGIATRATGKTGLSPLNTQGLRLRDGRVLPTYDWTVRR